MWIPTGSLSHAQTRSPGIPAVEAERDLVDAARVSHHQVETRLKAKQDSSSSSQENGRNKTHKETISSHINHSFQGEKQRF